jgi:anti-sigma B factor antagonist
MYSLHTALVSRYEEDAMPETKVKMDVRRASPEVSIIAIEGDMNGSVEDALMAAYNQANTPTTRTIVLNFDRLDYMNSSGIGLLVTLLIRANRQKQRLRACGLSEHYTHIFELTRLTDAIGIYDTEEAALTG